MSRRRTLFALCAVALSTVLLLPDVSSAQLFGRGGRFFGGGMGNYGGWGSGNYGMGNYGWGNYGMGNYGWGNPYSYSTYGSYYGGMPYNGNWGGNYMMPGYTYGNAQMYNYSSPIMQATYYPGTYSNGVIASGQFASPPGAWMDSVKNHKRALVDMEVPANAQVTFDGSPTQQQGVERRFITPPLDDPDSHYTYNVTAQWMQNGQQQRQSRTIRLTPGQTTFVNFLRPQNAQSGGNAAVSRESAYPPDGRSQGAMDPNRAFVDVRVPANAQVQFDGKPTLQQGPQRQFMTPPLDPNSHYTYKVTATWTDQNGKEHNDSRTVRLTPGQTTDVNFMTPQNNTQNQDGTQPRQQKTTPPER